MSKVIYLPFEPLPQRYTEMWNDAFIAQMSDEDVIVDVPGTKQSIIENGEFLDTFGTIEYKTKQMEQVVKLFKYHVIKDGDTFFVPDIFYPSLASIRYMAELTGIKVNIVAFNHAGRADEQDFVQRLGDWADTQEQAWHDMVDVVLVGSLFHAEKVKRCFNPASVVVTGAIWDSQWMKEKTKDITFTKENYIIYPHRPCAEKDFLLFLEIARVNPTLRFVITSCGNNRLEGVALPDNVEYRYNLTKHEYFNIFAHAKGYLSTAKQETFGYTLQEAIFFGCNIIVPNRACYAEYADAKSIVDVDNMKKPYYLTELFNNSPYLQKSVNVADNTKKVYDICQYINLKTK